MNTRVLTGWKYVERAFLWVFLSLVDRVHLDFDLTQPWVTAAGLIPTLGLIR